MHRSIVAYNSKKPTNAINSSARLAPLSNQDSAKLFHEMKSD